MEQEPFWAAIVVILFVAGLSMIAKSVLAIAGTADLFPNLAICILGIVIVAGLLIGYGGHPRTRSGSASASFAAMKALMFLAGVILFLGGASQIIKTAEFVEQIALAVLALVYTVTPLCLHFIGT